MCCAPNVYMFVYTLIGAHLVPLNLQITSEHQTTRKMDLPW